VELTSDQKGSIAEAEIAAAAIRLGIGVVKPLTDGERYDLIFDLRPRLLRVQCKWARRHGDVIIVRCYSARRNRDGLLRRLYSSDEIDAVAAYCPDVDRCYLLPLELALKPAPQLRLAPTRNNQKLRVNWAADYEFAAIIGRLGAVAQLGERQRGTLEARGSIPLGSTLFD
jgi:hypothetical protein